MSRGYMLGGLTSTTGLNTTAMEFRAGARPMFLEELVITLEAATASKLALGRPANSVGVGGTLLLGSPDLDPDEVASEGGVVLSGQTTVPTAPTTYKGHLVLPGTIGNGFPWQLYGGIRIKQGTSLVIWNIAASSAFRFIARWRE